MKKTNTLFILTILFSLTIFIGARANTGADAITVTLVNSDTDTDIRILKNTDTVYYSSTSHINVRADYSPRAEGFEFRVDGKVYKQESMAPYSLAGDRSGDYLPWVPTKTSHTITATPYLVKDGQVYKGESKTISLILINQDQTQNPMVTFALINAETDQDIGPLVDGQTINLLDGNIFQLNIRANSAMPNTKSIVFHLDNMQNKMTENKEPYALFGDVNGNYGVWTPALKTYTLTATPYTGLYGSGVSGAPVTISFKVIQEEIKRDRIKLTLVNSDTDQDIKVLKAEDTVFVSSTKHINIRADYDPRAEGFKFLLDGKPYSNESMSPFALAGDHSGNYLPWHTSKSEYVITAIPYLNNNGQIYEGEGKRIKIWIIKEEDPEQPMVSFSLINADTDLALSTLNDGDTINLAKLPSQKLNISAESSMPGTNSIIFQFNKTYNKTTENKAPYSVFGDFDGDFNPWTPSAGMYTLTATPYTGKEASGTSGTPVTINFYVISDQSGIEASVSPNPAKENVRLSFRTDQSSDQTAYISIYDLKGKIYYGGNHAISDASELNLNLEELQVPSGLLLVKLNYQDGKEQITKIHKD